MKVVDGGVTAAKGFQAAATAAGIKYKDRSDMAMIYSEVPCKAAGTFTTNVVKAAPVLFDKKVVEESPYVQAVVVNAGIANTCTGQEGYSYCEKNGQGSSGRAGCAGKRRIGGIHRSHRNAASNGTVRGRHQNAGTEAE